MTGRSGEAEAARCEAAQPSRGRALSGLVWAVSLPLLFAEVGEAVIHATDTALLARVGTTELAAIALADIVRELWVVPAIGLTEAAQIVIARRVGERHDRAVGATFARSALLVLVVALLLMVGLKITAPYLSDYLVGSGEVGSAVEDFLQIAAYGVPFEALTLVYSALYVGLGRTRVLVTATVVLALSNLVLSYALIFGKLGLPRLGIEGAAVGYVGAEAATFLYLTVHTLRRRYLGPYGVFRLRAPRAPAVAALGRLSAPAGLQAFVEVARWFVFFLILEQVSDEALAWSNLVYACFALLLIPTYAFGETAYSLVSRAVGSGRAGEIASVVRKTSLPALLVTLPFSLAALAFPEAVLSLFTDDPAAIDGAAGTLRLVAVTLLVVIPAEMWVAAVFGTGDTDAALGIEVVTAVVMLVGGYLAALVFDLDLPYIWLSVGLASLIGLPVAYGWVRAGYWRRREI